MSAKFDNVSSTFFVYHLTQKYVLPQTVLGQWNCSLDPQFFWIIPWLGWKAIYVETLHSAFLSAKFDNVSSTFFVYHLGQNFFPSDCTRTVTLLPRPSIHLNKSMTRLKSDLCWNTIQSVFEREIWQSIEYFFCIPLMSKILSLSDCTQTVTILPTPSIHMNKSLIRLKSDLFWNTTKRVFEREIWQRIEKFFCIPPMSKIFSASDCSWTVTLLTRPSIHLNISLTRLKSDLCWNTIKCFLSAKIDNVSSTFFKTPKSKIFSPQTVLGNWQFSLDPQLFWISPWLGWKTIYVETLNSAFLSAKIDSTIKKTTRKKNKQQNKQKQKFQGKNSIPKLESI